MMEHFIPVNKKYSTNDYLWALLIYPAMFVITFLVSTYFSLIKGFLKVLPLWVFTILILIYSLLMVKKKYWENYYTPKKLRWDEEGIEMINVFDKRVKIPWKYILTVKYYREKIFGKWEEAYYVRYRIPDLFIFKRNRFWVSKEIGDELYTYWARIKVKEEWGLRDEDMDKVKIWGGENI